MVKFVKLAIGLALVGVWSNSVAAEDKVDLTGTWEGFAGQRGPLCLDRPLSTRRQAIPGQPTSLVSRSSITGYGVIGSRTCKAWRFRRTGGIGCRRDHPKIMEMQK